MHLLLCLLYFNPRSHERSDGNCYTLTSNSGISIHAPTRGATMVAILNQKIPVFQSTLPREERLFGFGIRVIISIFQSTLPREERRPCSRHSLRILLFQSTLPREERRYPHGLQSLLFHNFNPRSHERSDIPAGSFHCCLHYISIHAPTRGATAILHKKFVYFYTIPTINI